ncbi:hypothetical protein [Kitasatospora sp. NPDC051914]|uniref:hypothetical protein n=1 Tax=Kitasatospora sp. NPDC051914 TaxID=3154945 RepID=UPI0034321CBB
MSAASEAMPDVAIGHHPDHGIVATLPTRSASAQWMLERLDFQRIPGHPSLYALTDQQREVSERAAWAIRLLTAAGHRVDTGMPPTVESTDEQARVRSRPGATESQHSQDPDPGPDVSFAEHPGVGVVAAVDNGRPISPAVFLETDGWRHHRGLDVYLPPAATRAEALGAVVRSTVALQQGNYRVAMQPQLAEAVAAHHVPTHQAFTTHKFRVDEAALAKSPTHRPGPAAPPATVPAVPPKAAVDPRIAFARGR